MTFKMKHPVHVLPFVLLFYFSCSSTPLPRNGPADIPEDFFGMVHAGRTRTPEEYRLLETMGVKWMLNTFYWESIEHEKGVFDFSEYDKYVDTARKEGKKIVAVLGYETPWLFPKGKRKRYISSENLPLFLNYVEETVRHFKGRVDVWNIWNEPNLMFVYWRGRRKEYIELTRLAAQRILKVDPDAYIMGGAFWRAPRGLIKNMHKAGSTENLDGMAFHPYSIFPQGSTRAHDKLLGILSEINYPGAVWVTEVGYPTAGWYPTKVSLDKLPAYVVKTISGAAARGARVLLWYQLFDDYNEGEVPPSRKSDSELFFGLAYPDYSYKKGAWAYELCAGFLPGSRYSPGLPERENVPSHIVSLCFMGGLSGNNTLILWNDRERPKKVNLYLPAPASLYDISTGQGRPLEETVLDIGSQPLIITWKGPGTPRLSVTK